MKTRAENHDVSPAQARAKRARRKTLAAFSLGRQAVLFVCLTILLLFVDLFLYIGISIYENTQAFGNGSPTSVTFRVADDLTRDEKGAYELSEYAQSWMDEEQCWAILIADDGTVAWSRNAPESVVRPYTLTETAVFVRIGYLDDYPCFVCEHEDGLLVAGFPKDSYAMFPISYWPQQTMARTPFYALFIFVVDAAIMFLAYVISRRRVEKNIEPMVKSLDDLARGKPTHIVAKGALLEVGESINAASAIMRRKDEARKRWVAGVSHDIRTPLAIVMGHAERIEHDSAAAPATQESARIIIKQGARIRDLVADLNIASKLEYDMQPVDVKPVAFAKLLRAIAVDYANNRLDERFAIEADVAEEAETLVLSVDERLVNRAIHNLIDNAIRHNDAGCTVTLSLNVASANIILAVADDGDGMSESSLARLNDEAAAIACRTCNEDPRDNGPVPPPHFEQYRRDSAPDDAPPTTAPDENGEPTLRPKELASFNEHGLGLSLVARIVVTHGGRIEFSNAETGGFVTTMTFPRDDARRI